jgi:predicted tellurium resistance membrane protein TerC
MEWMTDPTAVLGFITLVILEIILGIDNLIFISIVTEKLPPNERNTARFIGLSLALIMRIALLFCISWLATLTSPLIEINDKAFSGRDLILLGGGIFLLFKATIELHDRIEGIGEKNLKASKYASFWSIIIQVIILDAVFSIDSIITAIGMVDDISIMISAVVISVIVMMLASNPLTKLVNAHPTLIILCLGFLLMIGFSLIAEGFGFHIPKGYLYTSIGFSLGIETINQLIRRNKNNEK